MRRGNRLEAVRPLLIRCSWNKCPQFLVITLCCEKRDGAWTPGASESKTGQTNGGNQKGGKTGRKEGGWERRCTRWFLWPCCGSLASWVLQRLGSERQTGKWSKYHQQWMLITIMPRLSYHWHITTLYSKANLYPAYTVSYEMMALRLPLLLNTCISWFFLEIFNLFSILWTPSCRLLSCCCPILQIWYHMCPLTSMALPNYALY